VLRRALAVLLPLAFAAPLLFLVLGALRPTGAAAPLGPELFPTPPSVDSFSRAFELQPLGRQLRNSLIVAAIAVPLSVASASAAGFGLPLLPDRPRRLLLGLALALLVVPPAALWVPRFVLFSELGLTDTYVPLIAPGLLGTSSLFVLLFYWSYRRLPSELIDASRLEGLGAVSMWWRVGVPLTLPTAFAVGALAFVLHWSNFIEPLLYLFDPDKATLPIGLRALKELKPTDFGVLMAGALVATVPAVLAFAAVQRRFLASTRGAGWLGR
jgi:multiple sugar transport system permease protein